MGPLAAIPPPAMPTGDAAPTLPSSTGFAPIQGLTDLDAASLVAPTFDRVMAWAGLMLKTNVAQPLSGECTVRLFDVFLKYRRLADGQSTDNVHHSTGPVIDPDLLSEDELLLLEKLTNKATKGQAPSGA